MAATTPRKRTTRTVTPVAPFDDGGELDLIDLDAQSDEERSEFEQTAPLFRINGKVFEARTTFTAGEAMTYARTVREHGFDDANAYAMRLAVGEEGWQAILTHPYLSNDKAAEIIEQVVSRVLPTIDPKSRKQ